MKANGRIRVLVLSCRSLANKKPRVSALVRKSVRTIDYGIGLSDTHIFDTGQGLCPFERSDARFVVDIEHLAFPPDQTIKRLKYALSVFADWEYTLPGWNCEHLGRLIVTDLAQMLLKQSYLVVMRYDSRG